MSVKKKNNSSTRQKTRIRSSAARRRLGLMASVLGDDIMLLITSVLPPSVDKGKGHPAEIFLVSSS